MRKIPAYKMGDLEVLLLLGAMGVGITARKGCSTFANLGGGAAIASVGLGTLKGYSGGYIEANERALGDEIDATRELQNGNGAVGVNVMRALRHCNGLVKVAVDRGVDYIATGAGHPVPIDLPELVPRDSEIDLIPITSSARGANIVVKRWYKKFGRVPDAVVIEGPKAGGHLGFVNPDEIAKLKANDPDFLNKTLYREIEQAAEMMEKYDNLPIIGAGGVFTGEDIYGAIRSGASGVQMATRFVTTEEMDAHINFKNAYIAARQEDLMIIDSPVGLPGRAIRNAFLDASHEFACDYQCLETCKPRESSYCIGNALVNAQRGNLQDGFVFAGYNASRCEKIVPMKEVFDNLQTEFKGAI